MAEKRKLLAEVDKCFKKIDEGVELFEEIMNKVQEANSDNQREKYQDDLKKEIKKLQRLRDQVKVWQTSTDIKDKDKLNQYRKLIEQRMEQFKDIERENKTKPHSKQGLCAEEKLDPKEKEKSDTIDWLQGQLRVLNDESDRTEMQLESLNSTEVGKRGRKGGDSKKGDKDKKQETLNHRLERLKFHIGKLEIVMRMVNNESLDAKTVLEVLKDTMEMYTDCFDPNYDGEEEDFDSLDPEDTYEELDLGQLCAQLGTIQMNSVDEEKAENGHDVVLPHETPMAMETSRHGSTDMAPPPNTPASPAPRRTVAAVAATAPQPSPKPLAKENSTETTPAPVVAAARTTPVPSTPVATATPPPPPGIPYNSVAAGRVTTAAPTPPQTAAVNTGKATFPIPSIARQPNSQAATVAAAAAATTSAAPSVAAVEEKKPAVVETEKLSPMSPAPPPPIVDSYASIAKPQQTAEKTDVVAKAVNSPPVATTTTNVAVEEPPKEAKKPWDNDSSKSSPIVMNGPTIAGSEVSAAAKSNDIKNDAPPGVPLPLTTQVSQTGMSIMDPVAEEALRVLRMNQQNSTEPKRANIPAWLGASPLGRAPHQAEHDLHLAALENAFSKCTLPFESERPRIYLPKIPCPVAPHYPQVPAPNGDTLEYYLRLSPETLFFIFYYMEGTKAQLLAAKALKKLSWRFHTKYLTWFQRHEEPKQITDDFEQGTYVYFDFEKWSQRKKEAFTFEYRFLEDKEFD